MFSRIRRGGFGAPTRRDPIASAGMCNRRGSSSTSTSVSVRTASPSTPRSPRWIAPEILLHHGERLSKGRMASTATPRLRRNLKASESVPPTACTTMSRAGTDAIFRKVAYQRSASEWNRGSESTTHENTPRELTCTSARCASSFTDDVVSKAASLSEELITAPGMVTTAPRSTPLQPSVHLWSDENSSSSCPVRVLFAEQG